MHGFFQAQETCLKDPYCRHPDKQICSLGSLLLPIPPTFPCFQVRFPARRNPDKKVSCWARS